MQDFLDSLCESNFMISKIFAHASSEDSRSLCENFGFKWKAKHKFHTKKYRDEEIPTDIYELDIALSFENIIDQTRKKLLKNYAKYYQSNWLIRLIYSGESDVLEFKRFDGGFEGINRAICAMSNAGGGTVLIGIEDNRSVMGVNLEKYRGDSDRFSQALTSSMLSNIQGLSPRDVTVKCHWIDRKCVFAVEVRDAKSSISGVGFTRVGTTTRRLD